MITEIFIGIVSAATFFVFGFLVGSHYAAKAMRDVPPWRQQ